MIVENTKKNIHTNGNIQSTSCTIDAEDMRYIASLLRNNYSDTMLATIREIVANAIDVTESKKPEIKLPTRLEPQFSVRDYGNGLSEEDMVGLYTKYGKSTKRSSNNAIGGFGIGRFAPLSYTESFIVSSVISQRKITYSIRIDENDDTVVSKISDERCAEENGIFVQVPIAEKDISDFLVKFKNFSLYLKDCITVLNETIEYPVPAISCDYFDYFIDEPSYHYSIKHECKSAYVLMGGIMYPVTNSTKYPLLSKGMVYKAEIGEFKLHHSREALEYNNKTVQSLIDASDNIKNNLKKYFDDKINQAKCLYHATEIFYSRYKLTKNIGITNNLKMLNSSFNNFELDLHLFPKSLLSEVKLASRTSFEKLTIKKLNTTEVELTPIDSRFLIIDDNVTPRSPHNRLSFLKEGESALLLTFKPEVIDKIIKRKNAMSNKHVLLLSECERVKISRVKNKHNDNSISSEDILELVGNSNTQSRCWKKPTEEFNDNDTYYYVRYHNNKVLTVNGKQFETLSSNPEGFDMFVTKLQKITDKSFKLYGVRGKNIKNVSKHKNWVPFEDVYEEWITSCDKVYKLNRYKKMSALFDNIFHSKYLPTVFSELNTSNKIAHNMKMLFDEFKELKKEVQGFVRFTIPANLINVDISKEEQVYNTFLEQYPLIKHFFRYYSTNDKNLINDLIEYINRW